MHRPQQLVWQFILVVLCPDNQSGLCLHIFVKAKSPPPYLEIADIPYQLPWFQVCVTLRRNKLFERGSQGHPLYAWPVRHYATTLCSRC